MSQTLKEKETRRKARENVDKWGQQPPGDLAAALAEELGELLDEVITDGCPDLDGSEYDPLGEVWGNTYRTKNSALNLQDTLDENYDPTNDIGLPARDDMNVEEVREELYDIMALCYQLDWALYQGVEVEN